MEFLFPASVLNNRFECNRFFETFKNLLLVFVFQIQNPIAEYEGSFKIRLKLILKNSIMIIQTGF